jgi:hypothetical protein
MNKLLALLFFLLMTYVNAQEIPVNMYTGTPIISFPLWTLSDHDISIPISLSYSANGVKLEQSNGWYGLGWSLDAGGSIERQLRGLPDDYAGTGTDTRKGWNYLNQAGTRIGTDIGNFSNTADLLASTCSDEQADYAAINSFGDVIDTEPDIFSISFPGYTGSFLFDNSAQGQIRLIPYADIEITYTTVSSSDKSITSFTVKTNNGFKYVFGQVVTETRKTVKSTGITTPTFLTHPYNLYSTIISWATEWKLTRIESPSGAAVDLVYTAFQHSNPPTKTPVNMGIYYRSLNGYKVVLAYTIEDDVNDYWLDYIQGSAGQKVKFEKPSGENLGKVVISDSRRAAGNEMVKEYLFDYSGSERKFLKKITESSGCDRMPPYSFGYISGLPSIQSKAKDFWGYYNGKVNNKDLVPKMYVYPDEPIAQRFRLHPIAGYTGTEIVLDGADRLPDESSMKAGTLNMITYPSGGSAIIQYEANTFYDGFASTEYKAGGLRIKTITQYDGMNSPGRITKVFEYKDPSTGVSSGKLISRPMFVVPAWRYRDPSAMNDSSKDQFYSAANSANQNWKLFTIRTENDIANEETTQGSPVGYQFVTVKRPGAGAARFEFLVPGTYGQTSAGNFVVTENKFARSSNCPSMNIASDGGAWGYPFSRNPKLDHERGLIWKKTELNESNQIVRFTQNDYQFLYKSGSQPYVVSGLQYDRYSNAAENVFFYGKYVLQTDYDKVLSKETVTTYDAATGRSQTESTEYFYESAFHKFLTRTKTTGSDGTIFTTKFKYPHDFGTIANNSQQALLRIRDLQDVTKFRHAVVVEQINSVQYPGASDKVTGASFVKFSDFGQQGKILPEQTLSLNTEFPITAPVESSIVLNSGTYELNLNPAYEVVSSVVGFDTFDKPIGAIDLTKTKSASVWGFNKSLPVATVSNALPGEFAFSDFETATIDEFQLTNAYYSTPRAGAKGLHPFATLQKTITKGLADNYLLSFWLKNSGSVSFRVLIKSTDLATTYYDETFAVTPTSTSFEFVQKKIPVSNAPGTFVIQLLGQGLSQPSGSSSTLLPSVDDVGFAPEQATITSFALNIPYGSSAVTDNRTGKTTFTEHDKLGRTRSVSDQDKNMVTRNTYTYSQPLFSLIAAFSVPINVYTNEEAIFYAVENSCISGVTYKWKISPETEFTTGTAQKNHTFTTSGTFRVTLQVSATSFETLERYVDVIVAPRPITVNVCANGAVSYECGDERSYANLCSSNPPDQTGGTHFSASVLNETLSGVTYTWKKRYVNSGSWVTVGTSSTYAVSFVSPHSPSFEIKCEITGPNGRTGSDSFLIDVYPCQ